MDLDFDPPTPPMRRPKATPRKAKTLAAKKNNFSAAAFAKMALVNQQEIEQLKPLPRPHLENTMDDDSDQDILVFGDDGDDVSIPDTNDVAPPRSPNYNPDLSDDDMSRSPSPFNPANIHFCLPEAIRYAAQKLNVPSVAPEAYFQKNIPRINELYVNKPTADGQRVKTKLPIAYWKWPSGADEHKAEQDRKARNRENYVPTPFNPIARTLNDTEIKINIQPTARPPHINWALRKMEVEQEAKDKEAAAVALAAKLKKEKDELRKKMLLNKDAADAAVLAGIQLDEDGFFKIKGTRKRRGPGIDMEEGRKRRTYTWKAGPPLRGKALKEAREKAELEAEKLMKIRQERIDRGEDITDSNESDSSNEEEEEDKAPITTKIVKKVTKAGKTAIDTRNSAAPKKLRAPRKPAARKKTTISKKKASLAAKRVLDGSGGSGNDFPVSNAKKAPVKKATAPKKTLAKKRVAADSDDFENDSPPTPVAKKTLAKKIAVPKKTPTASAKRVSVNHSDSELEELPVSITKKKLAAKRVATPKKAPAPKKTPGPEKTSTLKETPASKKSATKANEPDADNEDIDEPPTPPAKKTPAVRKIAAPKKTPAVKKTAASKIAQKPVEYDDDDERDDEAPTPAKKTPAAASTMKKTLVSTSVNEGTAGAATPAAKKIIAPKKKAAKPRVSAGFRELKDLA